MSPRSSPEPLRLGFVRGTSPGKWAKRWAEARPHHQLLLLPLGFSGSPVIPCSGESPGEPDVTLERVSPGDHPASTRETTGNTPSRRAVRLYTEGVALVVPVDHELAEYSVADRETLDLVRLLDHPDHLSVWPAAEPWQDSSWLPKHAGAAMKLVATGAGAILLPSPLARELGNTREHVVIPVVGEPELPGTEIWVSWDVARDGEDVQQLIGVMRGRTARSSRGGDATVEESKSSTRPQPQPQPQSQPRPQRVTKSRKAGKAKRGAKTLGNSKSPGSSKSQRKPLSKGTSRRRGSR